MLLKLITAFPNACILNAKNQKYWFHGNHQKFIITLITCTSKDIFNIFLFYICMFAMLILKFWSLHSLVEHCSSLYIHVAKSISFHCNRKGKRVYWYQAKNLDQLNSYQIHYQYVLCTRDKYLLTALIYAMGIFGLILHKIILFYSSVFCALFVNVTLFGMGGAK